MQFATNGYVLDGNALTLVANGSIAPAIRVGDGSSGGAGYVAIVDNVLTGSDGLVKTDYGTLTLTGASTYTGGTTIGAGTLQLGNGGTTGSIVGDVTDNGTLAFDRSDAVTFGNVVSGPGTLSQSGNGTLTLSGNNIYTGTTTISAGTLALAGTGGISHSSNIVDNSTFDISAAAGGASIVSLSGNGNVSLGTNNLTLSNGSSTFAGTISG
ncbi:autotransporter-associated beta strand repeat-containing protein, partial [Rhodanobacter ginsengisoli]